ncbi:MAG: hypothetical protein AAF289_02770 [Cyanobacteria bacterium P01_A01_bin.135]
MTRNTTLLAALLGLGALSVPLAAQASSREPIYIAQSAPTTYMTPQDANSIAVQISEGEFFFSGIMQRTYGNLFSASDNQVRVTYDRDTGRVVVINAVAGNEFYNYFFTEASSSPGTASTPVSTPVTYTTPQNANQIAIQISEGEFFYSGILERTSGNTFIGSDGRVRVIYDRGAARVVVINVVTGTEFYNYAYSDVNEGAL